MSTIAEHLQQAADLLEQSSDSPRLDAEVLLARMLRIDRGQLLLRANNQLETDHLEQFQVLVQKRQQGVPIAYLTGQQEFFGLLFNVTPDVLIPRPATELLVEVVLKHLPADSTMTIADVGTGSGAIALTLAQHLPAAKIIASDVESAALSVAQKNARRLGLAERVTFLHSDLLENYTLQPDLVIANLPYLTVEQMTERSIQHEPRQALVAEDNGLALIKNLLAQAANRKKLPNLILEFDPTQEAAVLSLLQQHFPSSSITPITDGQAVRGIAAWQQS